MYVDPNTGGMLFQILAVIFVFFSGMILVFSSRIKMLWARLKRKKSTAPDQPDETDTSI
jgi:hypothetical protein